MDCLGRRIKLAVKLTYGHYSSLAIAIGFCSTQIRFSRPVVKCKGKSNGTRP